MVWKKTVSDEYYICVTPWQSLKTFIWLHFSAYLSPSSNYRFPKQRRVQGQGKVFHQLDKASWTNISAGQIVNHLVRARSNKVFEENHHLSRDAGTTCSFVTCDFFRGYCWNLRGINHTQKWINPHKKRMAFSSLGETLSLQNHTKSWKGHPATPSPPPDTLPRPRFDGHFLGIAGEVVFFLHMSGVHQASCRCLAYATDQLLEVVFSKLSPVVRRPGTQ